MVNTELSNKVWKDRTNTQGCSLTSTHGYCRSHVPTLPHTTMHRHTWVTCAYTPTYKHTQTHVGHMCLHSHIQTQTDREREGGERDTHTHEHTHTLNFLKPQLMQDIEENEMITSFRGTSQLVMGSKTMVLNLSNASIIKTVPHTVLSPTVKLFCRYFITVVCYCYEL